MVVLLAAEGIPNRRIAPFLRRSGLPELGVEVSPLANAE
jgi:hypothetical protein